MCSDCLSVSNSSEKLLQRMTVCDGARFSELLSSTGSWRCTVTKLVVLCECTNSVIEHRKHYLNLPMEYTEMFPALKIESFTGKFSTLYLYFDENIHCGYTLEPHCRCESNPTRTHNVCLDLK